jgi:tyrosyl-tRNA synthetase
MEEIINRGVEEIIDKGSLVNKLESGKKLRVKLGIDPTSPNIHLGRSIPLLKLRDFQNEGHTAVFIVGDFTAMIGDTSDKESERPMLSKEEVTQNLKSYVEQAGKIVDLSKTEVHYNSKWLGTLDFNEIGRIADAFSLSDFISRENIKKRLDAGKRVSLRELLYPIMQGYDSVEVNADVEIGGTDQKFNLLAGRNVQRLFGQTPQDILMNPLVVGLDGRKMSSSFGNTINLTDSPNDMFGKVMSLEDEYIISYFSVLTRVGMGEIDSFKKMIDSGSNPRDIKINLAMKIVEMYHSKDLASMARDYFVSTFTNKEIPKEVDDFRPSAYNIIAVLVESGLATSKSDAKRLLEQEGIKIDGQVVKEEGIEVRAGSILQKGKLKFLRIV